MWAVFKPAKGDPASCEVNAFELAALERVADFACLEDVGSSHRMILELHSHESCHIAVVTSH